MIYLRPMHIVTCVLIMATLLAAGISLSLSVIHWFEEDYRDSQIEWQLSRLAAIYKSETTQQDHDPTLALRKVVFYSKGSVGIWRVDKAEDGIHTCVQLYGTQEGCPAAVRPVDPYSAQFLDGQYVDKKWRAVQRVVSDEISGDVLIRVYRPRESLTTFLGDRLSDAVFLLPGFAALSVALLVWAASKTHAPLDALTDALKQSCNDSSVPSLPEHIPFRGFEHLVTGINELLTKTRSQNERMAGFASETAHELRAPLTLMRIIGEIALREPKDAADLRECIGAILEECQHMDQLIEGILLIAQAQSKRVAVAISQVDLALLAAEYVDKLAPLAEASGMSLELSAQLKKANCSTLLVACDRTLLRQAGFNLIHNAIVHNAPGTRIVINAESTDEGSRLIISDNGIGFNPHAEEAIFKRKPVAYSSLKIHNRGRNLGLGLSIATSLVEAQGAQLAISSKVGGGTRISIIFPHEPSWSSKVVGGTRISIIFPHEPSWLNSSAIGSIQTSKVPGDNVAANIA